MNTISAAFQQAATAVAKVPHLNIGLATVVTAAAALFAFKVIGLAALLATLFASLSLCAMNIYAKSTQAPPEEKGSDLSTSIPRDNLSSSSASDDELELKTSRSSSPVATAAPEVAKTGFLSRLGFN